METPFEKLALDYWYKALMAGGAVVFILVGAGLIKEFPKAPTALISLGSLFFGMGEWINHPLQTKLLQGGFNSPSGIIKGHPRSARTSGVLFDLLGGTLICYGLVRLWAE